MTALDMFPEARVEDPNRRYTTREFMAWIKSKAGVTAWDLDAAADAESHHAPRWFSLLPYEGSAGVDGLAQSWLPPGGRCGVSTGICSNRCMLWPGHVGVHDCQSAPPWRIFVNPPFDDLDAWVAKAWEEWAASRFFGKELVIAFVLPGNRHEQPFWQEHVEPFRDGRLERWSCRFDCYFPPGRQAYAKPGSNGVAVGSAEWPSALLVWSRA